MQNELNYIFLEKNTEMILLSPDWSQNVKGEMLLIHVLLIMCVSTRVEEAFD